MRIKGMRKGEKECECSIHSSVLKGSMDLVMSIEDLRFSRDAYTFRGKKRTGT